MPQPGDTFEFEFVVDGILVTCISLFGFIGTVMSIRVLLKDSARNSFSNLLVGLAFCDASFLFLAACIVGLPKSWTW